MWISTAFDQLKLVTRTTHPEFLEDLPSASVWYKPIESNLKEKDITYM